MLSTCEFHWLFRRDEKWWGWDIRSAADGGIVAVVVVDVAVASWTRWVDRKFRLFVFVSS